MSQGASLECPICCELFDNASETICGHAFCELCIHKSLESSITCPICRKDPSPIHPSFTLRALVQEERQRRGECNSGTKEQQPASEERGAVYEQYQGNTCYRRGQYADAITHYNKAIQMKPNAVLHGNRAASYFKLRQFRAALGDYEKAEMFDSNNVKLLLGKALTLEKLRYYKPAHASFQQALTLNPEGQLRIDILAGLHRIMSMAKLLVPPTAVTTIAHVPCGGNSEYASQTSPLVAIQTMPTFQWQLHQELTFKEFLGAI